NQFLAPAPLPNIVRVLGLPLRMGAAETCLKGEPAGRAALRRTLGVRVAGLRVSRSKWGATVLAVLKRGKKVWASYTPGRPQRLVWAGTPFGFGPATNLGFAMATDGGLAPGGEYIPIANPKDPLQGLPPLAEALALDVTHVAEAFGLGTILRASQI